MGYASVVSDEASRAESARLYALYSSIFFTLGEYSEAAGSAQRGLDLLATLDGGEVDYDSDALRYLLAQALQGQGNQSDVLTMLSDMEQDTPETHGIRAYALHNAGDYDGALVHYREQVRQLEESGPSFQLAEALDFQGRLLVDQGRVDDGERLILGPASLFLLSEVDGSAVAMSLLSRGTRCWGATRST